MKSKTKLIVSAVSLFLALVLCVTGMWFLTELTQKTADLPEDDFAGGVIDEEGNELISGKEYEFGSDLTFLSASAKSVTSPEGVTLTAIIEPANATNKKVDWSVTYKNDASSWAQGKAVTNYVTVTPSEDGSLTATVKCLDAFGEQIIITVTSRSNPNITATCTVDYMKRLISSDFGFEGKSKIAGTDNYLFNITDFSLDAPNGGYGDDLMKGEKWEAKGSYTLGIGTKTPSITEEINYKMPGRLIEQITNLGLEYPASLINNGDFGATDAYYDVSSDPLGMSSYGVPAYTVYGSALFIEALLLGMSRIGELWNERLNEYSSAFEQFYMVYDDNSELVDPATLPFLVMEYNLTVNGNTTTKSVGLYMPLSNLEIAVQSIKLNQGGITA